MDTHAKTFGERIVHYRRLSGITQKQMAHRPSIDPSTTGRWERNKSQTSEKTHSETDFFFSTDDVRLRDNIMPDAPKSNRLFTTVTGLGALMVELGHFSGQLE